MNLHEDRIRLAIEVAKTSTLYRFKTGAVLYMSSQYPYIGRSHVSHHRMSDPGYKFSIHAELDLMMRAPKSPMYIRLPIYVATVNKNARYVTNSRPCKRCEALLAEFGVTHVYYTVHSPIDEPEYEMMVL